MRLPSFIARRAHPIVALAALAVLVAVVLSALALVGYTSVELSRFERATARRQTFVYAAPRVLRPGLDIRLVDLAGALARLGYTETPRRPAAPGQFQRNAGAWDVVLRGSGETGPGARRLRIELRGPRIARLVEDGRAVPAAMLEPEVLTAIGDGPGEDFRPIRLGDAPLVLLDAVVAAEDHRFFEHQGVDVHALVRAAWTNVRAGRVAQGGSTITQQLVKNRLLGPRRSFGRKLREAWLSAVLEWRYSKAQILEAYLNELYLGQRGPLAIRGVGAGARAYFGKEVQQLTLAEAALLAGLARAPNTDSPAIDPERARERRNVVLARMRAVGKISAAQDETARGEPVRAPSLSGANRSASYFTDYVRQELERRLGSAVAPEGHPLSVYTSLDPALQRFAEAAVARGLTRIEARFRRLQRSQPQARLQAVVVALDPTTGQVRALVGGRDYGQSQFNRAVLARRQPGSAFKPFVYLAALGRRHGDRPLLTAASIVDDTPLTVTVGGQVWSPRNYGDRYEGRVTVRRALEHSLNAATVRVAEAIGIPAVVEAAHRLGLPEKLPAVPALALGAVEVTPLELARAYLPFANGGLRPGGPPAIRAVREDDGTAMPLDAGPTERVIAADEAYLVTSLLEGAIDAGTGAAARSLGVRGAVAGKTGTTNDGRDAWFVGYSPALLALAWVGFDSGEAHGLSGADAALPIWADFMRQALDGDSTPAFAVPEGVTFAQIDATNGKLANRFCPVVARETFLAGTEPPPCDEHGGVTDRILDWWQRFRQWLGR